MIVTSPRHPEEDGVVKGSLTILTDTPSPFIGFKGRIRKHGIPPLVRHVRPQSVYSMNRGHQKEHGRKTWLGQCYPNRSRVRGGEGC